MKGLWRVLWAHGARLPVGLRSVLKIIRRFMKRKQLSVPIVDNGVRLLLTLTIVRVERILQGSPQRHLHTFCSRNRVRAHCFWGDWHSQQALLLLGLWGQPFLKTLNVVGLSWETCFCHEYILGRPGFSGIKNRGLDLLVFTLFILPEKVYARVLELLERTVYPTVEY